MKTLSSFHCLKQLLIHSYVFTAQEPGCSLCLIYIDCIHFQVHCCSASSSSGERGRGRFLVSSQLCLAALQLAQETALSDQFISSRVSSWPQKPTYTDITLKGTVWIYSIYTAKEKEYLPMLWMQQESYRCKALALNCSVTHMHTHQPIKRQWLWAQSCAGFFCTEEASFDIWLSDTLTVREG